MTVASIGMIPRKELRGQTVLVRVDAEDETKLNDSLPTLAFAAECGARLVVATHGGPWRSRHPIDAVAAWLGLFTGRPVNKLEDWKGEAGLRAVNGLDEGEILVLENLAFEDGEEIADDELADALGRLSDIYCNDAFALSHEVRASTVGAAKRAGRATSNGVVGSYIHMGGKVGVLVEVNCESDFVARTDDFKQLARDLALAIAGHNPSYVSRDEVPDERLASLRTEFADEAAAEGKSQTVIPAIVEGKLNKWYEAACLVELPYRDTDRKIGELITEKVALLGENIKVARFARMAVGENAD